MLDLRELGCTHRSLRPLSASTAGPAFDETAVGQVGVVAPHDLLARLLATDPAEGASA